MRAELKTRVKAALVTAESGGEGAVEAQRLAMKKIDKAAAKGVIHRNAASRRKSRLAKRLARAGAEV